jgi:hypothetical protein
MASPLLGLRSALFETGHSEAVTYTPAGPDPAGVSLRAVRSEDAAGQLSNLGGTPPRSVTFELQKADVPVKPLPNAIIADETARWRITQVIDQMATGTWLCTVQAAPGPAA